ncbi:MAG: hypothetical protein QOH76_2233 [Thermoleophilaceae bacterium]|nr:hypothetical protein [Thermoleophilaceae bacterium]
MVRALTLAAALLLASASASAAAPSAATLGIGLADGPGGAKKLRKSAPFAYRYQYLAGGVNTGDGWPTWNPNGSFATMYVRESVAAHVTPVFTLYTIRQSLPGRDVGDEAKADLGNLSNKSTMRDWYANARLLFKRAGAFHKRVIVHVEPDLWGYVEQAAPGDDASRVPAAVASTGDADLKGLPNDVSGFARAVVRLRKRYAHNVRLGYHLSVWGTKTDIALQGPPDKRVDALGRRAARFYRSLGAHFDMTFAEFSDRDSAFKEIVYGDGGASWWKAADFRRDVRFDRVYSRATKQRIVKWQIPLGNTLMRAMDDTWGHYRDNRAQWLLGSSGGRKHLRAYADAGVVALLFGGGADGTTCACDARGDGVTNPPPKHGNVRRSLSADDDGGYFRARVRAYYRAGAMRLR